MSTCHDPAPVRIHQPGSLILSPFDRHSRILDNNTFFRHYCIHLDLRYFHQVYTTLSHPFRFRAIRPCIVIFVILGHRFVQTCNCSLVRTSTNIHYLTSLLRRFSSVGSEGTLNCSDYAAQIDTRTLYAVHLHLLMLVVLVRFGRWYEMFLISDGGIRLLEEH